VRTGDSVDHHWERVLLALIAGTVSYLHMHLLLELNGQPGLLDGFHHADTQIFACSPSPPG
jgi:hypothetical protein